MNFQKFSKMKNSKIYLVTRHANETSIHVIFNNGEWFIIKTDSNTFSFDSNWVDTYMIVSYGYSWRNHCDIEKCTREVLQPLLREAKDENRVLKLSDLTRQERKILNQIKKYRKSLNKQYHEKKN